MRSPPSPTVGALLENLVNTSIELPSGELRLLQPKEAAEIPDVDGVEWAPVAPYWSVLWRSSVALARELDGMALGGLRVVELGCGLGVPSIAAARRGATVLATDECTDALELVARNARESDLPIQTAMIDWAEPDELVEQAPFDLVLASDVLYERPSFARLLSLMPLLAPVAWLADPGRPAAGAVVDEAMRRWPVETRQRGVVSVYRMELNGAGRA